MAHWAQARWRAPGNQPERGGSPCRVSEQHAMTIVTASARAWLAGHLSSFTMSSKPTIGPPRRQCLTNFRNGPLPPEAAKALHPGPGGGLAGVAGQASQ